ncbi:MAG: hypothetical protein P0S95_06960 [Rhabdochlamydiaceae bacterium]|nr:hypothetical protein [Candidatus Amphrikana amoebophyrae]
MNVTKWMLTLAFTPALCFEAAPPEAQESVKTHPDSFYRQAKKKTNDLQLPWFTGPLLTPSGVTLYYPHYNIEPYYFFTMNHGEYDSNRRYQSTDKKTTGIFLLPLQFGIGTGIEFDLVSNITTNWKNGESFTGIGDTQTKLEFQVCRKHTGFPPTGNVYVVISWPTGKYNHFSSHERDVQATGSGSFESMIGTTWSRAYHISGEHYFAWRSNLSLNFSSGVRVKGFNTYGGGFGCSGKVYPGWELNWDTGVEYSITKNWGLACDISFNYQGKTKFSGTSGTAFDGTEGKNTSPSNNQWSLAPAIEYDFNEHIGLIGGVWFTFAGRNSTAFTSGVLALNIYY